MKRGDRESVERMFVVAGIFGCLLLTIICPFILILTSGTSSEYAIEWGAYVLPSILTLMGPPLAYYFPGVMAWGLDILVVIFIGRENDATKAARNL